MLQYSLRGILGENKYFTYLFYNLYKYIFISALLEFSVLQITTFYKLILVEN